MEQIAILATSLGNRIETVLYAALLMGYIAFNLYRRSACRRQLTWQAAWLFCSMVLAILSGSINQLLYYQQQNTSTALEIFLWCNKVVPRLLWFPVLSAMGEFDLRWPDDILMTCYAAVMALTPRKSNLACLIWCVPFLWAMLRMKDHRDSRSHWLTLCLLVCAVLHLCNAAANISGFEDLGTLLRKTLGILGYPAVFTLDLYGRMAEARNSTPPPEGEGVIPVSAPPAPPDVCPDDDPESDLDDVSRAIQLLTERCALTPREEEIIRCVYDGMTNKQIAERLYVAEGTIKAHNYNIYSKLGVTKRGQLILLVNETRRTLR